MLSRRNIRIKVLQTLYMFGRDPELSISETLDFYRSSLNRSQDLYLFNLLTLIETSKLSLKDVERKKSKYLPSEEDKKFSAKLFKNPSMQALVQESGLHDCIAERNLTDLLEADNIKKFYKGFSKSDSYRNYILEQSGKDSDCNILLDLYKYLTKDEVFEESIEDHFPTWVDDKSLIIGAMKKTIKALPESPDLYRMFRPDYEAGVEFGEKLLQTVVDKDKEYEELIAPALENWEVDRVANIDMILLKMALCEFFIFASIPTKVTLNEYVELSKIYSTDKSKDFINGILDKLLKDLTEQGAITKTGRGLDE